MDHPELNPEIIHAFKKGDPEALTAFSQLFYHSLCYFATQLTGSAAEAEKIVKDTFEKLWYKHRDFENAENIKAFLYIATRNASLNFLRHLQVKEASRKKPEYLESSQGA